MPLPQITVKAFYLMVIPIKNTDAKHYYAAVIFYFGGFAVLHSVHRPSYL